MTRIAGSAWSYQERGRNWVQSSGVFQISAEKLKLIESGDALRLLAHLCINHGSRPEPFAVAVRAMAEHESIPGQGETALRTAREHLVQRGFLKRVHAGGSRPGDPAKFVLTQPAIPVVSNNGTQYNDTSSGAIREPFEHVTRDRQPAMVVGTAKRPPEMTKHNSNSKSAANVSRGVFIPVGGDEPDYLITSKLLASIARPPASASSQTWRHMVAAFARRILSLRAQLDPAWAQRPQLLLPIHYEMSVERAEKLVLEATGAINVAMGAAHALMPALVRGVALSDGEKLTVLPKPWRDERTLTAASERVMRHEADFAEFLAKRGETLPSRFPGIESAEAPANFRNRVVKPFRRVIHLAAGLAQVLDDVERELAAAGGTSKTVSPPPGFGAYPEKPRLLLAHVLLYPEFSIAAINRARSLEAGLPYLTAQRPKPEEVVRLCWVGDPASNAEAD